MSRSPSRTSEYRWSSNRGPDGLGSGPRPKLLLICDYRPREASTVLDHVEAIRHWSRADVFVLPIHGDLPDELDLEGFDGLVIHYNVVMSVDSYLSPLARWRINRYTGTKAAFIQDEYRFVNRTISVLRTLGINVLFTCVPEDQVSLVYGADALPDLRRTVSVLTGYVPPALLDRPTVPYGERPLDVGYRARRLPPWLGRLGMEKADIADRFAADAPAYELRVDISTAEEDRLYGDAWIGFLGRCKAMLGVESGASVFDFDGSIESRTRAYMTAHPAASFEQLHDAILAEADGRIRLNQISPRCFEAAALGTLMVLYPGRYSDVLEPWRHYVPLDKDHGNMVEVVKAIRDPDTWHRITAQARSEVAENPRYTFRAMVEAMDDGLQLSVGDRRPISAAQFEPIASRSFARMPSTRLHAGGLPPTLNRARHLPRRAARLLTPSPTALAVPPQPEGATGGPRDRVRHARTLAYWAIRPRDLPRSLLRAHRRALLEELGALTSIQEQGARAERTGVGSPYLVIADQPAQALRVVLATDAPEGDRTDPLPEDLGWVSTVRLAMSNPFLVPAGAGIAQDRTLEALSAVFQARPDVGRRLLAGRERWCAVVVASGSPLPAGADGA